MRISDWSSDVCSSDLTPVDLAPSPMGISTSLDANGLVSSRAATSRNPTSGIAHRLRHVGDRDKLLAVARNKRDFACLPVQIGRASCRDRVCQSVMISVVAVALKKIYIQQKLLI